MTLHRTNLLVNGYEHTAAHVKASIKERGRATLVVRNDGTLRMYDGTERVRQADRPFVVGTYRRDVPLNWIEDDLIAHMRDRTRKQA